MPSRFVRPLFFVVAKAFKHELAHQIEYLKAENEILRSKLPRQIRTTPAERKRLVKLGALIGPALKHIITLATYTTFLRWKRNDERSAPKNTKTGRPSTPDDVRNQSIETTIAKDREFVAWRAEQPAEVAPKPNAREHTAPARAQAGGAR